jgi:hypothetical protein
MAQTARASKLLDVVGQKATMAFGLAGGSGTSTVVTVPQMRVVKNAGAMGATSTTAVFVDTVSGNTFTVTHANNDLFFWIAVGDAKV